jgi:HptB-dependent secretion and biofilm anti anti-sigma factor
MLTSCLSPDGTTVTITPGGRFDFRMHREFRQAYATHTTRGHYVIDLGQTDYLDSSALGMLLLLREYAGGDKADIRILNCKPQVRTIFEVANFQKLFTLA